MFRYDKREATADSKATLFFFLAYHFTYSREIVITGFLIMIG